MYDKVFLYDTISLMKTYTRPPIVEAILEMKLDQQVSIKALDEHIEVFKGHYFSSKPVYKITGKMDSDGKVSSSTTHIGYKFSNEEQTESCNVERSAISVSRRAPYSGWENLFNRFEGAFEFWNEIFKTKNVERLGTRFVNVINIPNNRDVRPLESYLKLCLHTPEPSDLVTRYNATIVMPDPGGDKDKEIVVKTGIIDPVLVDHCSILLDIDVGWRLNRPLNRDVLQLFGNMRELKNESFERFLSETAKELFT